jgi:hypothetical protein
MLKIVVLTFTMGLGICVAQADRAAVTRYDFVSDSFADGRGSRDGGISRHGVAA